MFIDLICDDTFASSVLNTYPFKNVKEKKVEYIMLKLLLP